MITEDFEVAAADVDEQSIEQGLFEKGGYGNMAELAELTVKELSKSKASAVFEALGRPSDSLVIGADTVVALENEILGKPKDREDAVRMLRMQSLEPQKVITGVTLILSGQSGAAPVIRTFAEKTLVYFKPLDKEQEERIQNYCDTDEPYDKAGAYGIQLGGGSLVDRYEGEYENIVGFPVRRTAIEIRDLTGAIQSGHIDL